MNGVFAVAVNRVGKEDGLKFWGGSFVADSVRSGYRPGRHRPARRCWSSRSTSAGCESPGTAGDFSKTAVRIPIGILPAFLTGFRREKSETPSEQGARPEGTGGVLDSTSRSPTALDPA